MMIDVNGYYHKLVGIHDEPDVIRIVAFIDGLDDVHTISFILPLLLLLYALCVLYLL